LNEATLWHFRGHAERLSSTSTADLVRDDPGRATDFAIRVGPVYASFARQRFDREALAMLLSLARECDASGALRGLFDGVPVNVTEERAALHTALRSDLSSAPPARLAHAQARAARIDLGRIVQQLSSGDITDVISVGIGGSDLGPRLAVDALRAPGASPIRVHFLSNVDGHAAQRLLAELDPRRTAAVLISKSFGTQETLLNGTIVRRWLNDDSRLYAVSANAGRVQAEFGIPPARILPMWDWVGGRYSLWSAVGLPIALAVGLEGYDGLLAGAAEMDAHVLAAPLERNQAVWHALAAVGTRNGLGLGRQAAFPYDDRLKLLPTYLQQLVMESLGKSTASDGRPAACATAPVWWGGAGTDTQHSFFQALHQGSDPIPSDLIGVVAQQDPYAANHRALLSNLLAQSETLALGQPCPDPHRHYPGNRPNTLILLDELTPHTLGMLLALYEHSVYLQGLFWGINPFDQFGVELGKQVAQRLMPALDGEALADDPVTRAVVAQMHGQR